MIMQTDENQSLNVLHRYDSADGLEPNFKRSSSIWQYRQTRTKLSTLFIDMTVQTDENQTLNVLHPYDSADGR